LVRDALADCSEIDIRDTAELLTSELVTNALLHTRTDLTVHVLNADPVAAPKAVVRVAVDDGSDTAPAMGDPEPGSVGGRGLPLVAILATRWGWEPLAVGKRVWFEV
jgi:anti-sigma regulatory factor (Ser/Thr protein kinase)